MTASALSITGSTPPRLSPTRGFLPDSDPLACLPGPFGPWEELARDLPKLLAAGRARSTLADLRPLDPAGLAEGPEAERAMLLLSYFGHAFVWGGGDPVATLPPGVAVPWHAVARRLGRPPVLSYASYALHNWRRLDPSGPIALGNLALLQNFLGGLDEEWFVLVHVEIEALAAPALADLGPAQGEAAAGDVGALAERLGQVAEALERMLATLDRMPEGCDPYIYFHRVRPYLHGWRDHPALAEGVVYEGVEEYGGKPRRFRGETGAQTGIIPSLDAFLGIEHGEDELRHYLRELREYMPPAHRAFVEALEAVPSVREFVLAHGDPPLRTVYDACVAGVERFRSRHLEYAGRYVQLQARRSAANPTDVGTGGTPFMPYLRKHRDETAAHRLP